MYGMSAHVLKASPRDQLPVRAGAGRRHPNRVRPRRGRKGRPGGVERPASPSGRPAPVGLASLRILGRDVCQPCAAPDLSGSRPAGSRPGRARTEAGGLPRVPCLDAGPTNVVKDAPDAPKPPISSMVSGRLPV